MNEPIPMSGEKKSVRIEEADNGYIVEMYAMGPSDGPGERKEIVCKTVDEALTEAKKLLGSKEGPNPTEQSDAEQKNTSEAESYFSKSKSGD